MGMWGGGGGEGHLSMWVAPGIHILLGSWCHGYSISPVWVPWIQYQPSLGAMDMVSTQSGCHGYSISPVWVPWIWYRPSLGTMDTVSAQPGCHGYSISPAWVPWIRYQPSLGAMDMVSAQPGYHGYSISPAWVPWIQYRPSLGAMDTVSAQPGCNGYGIGPAWVPWLYHDYFFLVKWSTSWWEMWNYTWFTSYVIYPRKTVRLVWVIQYMYNFNILYANEVTLLVQ